MKHFSLLAVALAMADMAVGSACNADNCARAVTGTNGLATTSKFRDCQSFMACTVTPAPVTVTSAVTYTVTEPATTLTTGNYPENKRKRSVYSSAPAASSAVTSCPSAVPTYASACSGTVRYSSACSCFGATQATVTATASTATVTTTVMATLPGVVTVQPAAPSLCGNAGLQWALHRDFQRDDTDQDAQNFDPTVIKPDTPILTGVTDYLHYSTQDGTVYGQQYSNNQYLTIEHRGYIFAPETGLYTFIANNPGKNLDFWFGSVAYSGWTADNAIFHTFQTDGKSGPSSIATFMNMVAGNYYPIRIVYHNDVGQGQFDMTATAPSGYQVIGSNATTAQNTPYVVQFSCDGSTAPPFQPFGQET